MRRIPLLGVALLIPALALCLVAGGCTQKGAEKPKDTTASTTTPAPEDKGKPAEKAGGGKKETLTAKTDGKIKGTVKYDGTPPTPEAIALMKAHADKEICLAGSEHEKVDQTWLIGKDNGVANVVVFLAPPAGSKFNITDDLKKPFHKSVVLDQPHCAFIPHVLAFYPGAGEKVEVKNSSKTTHNTKIVGDPTKDNNEQNVTLGPGKSDPNIKINYQSTPLTVACNLHPWMNAKIWTFNQPYFAVTKDDGSYEIDNVPTDVELKVMYWHESMGNNPKEAEKHTFKSGDNMLNLKISK